MGNLSIEEALRVSDAFLLTLYGSDVYERWVEVKDSLDFPSERDFVIWVLDMIDDYRSAAAVSTLPLQGEEESCTVEDICVENDNDGEADGDGREEDEDCDVKVLNLKMEADNHSSRVDGIQLDYIDDDHHEQCTAASPGGGGEAALTGDDDYHSIADTSYHVSSADDHIHATSLQPGEERTDTADHIVTDVCGDDDDALDDNQHAVTSVSTSSNPNPNPDTAPASCPPQCVDNGSYLTHCSGCNRSPELYSCTRCGYGSSHKFTILSHAFTHQQQEHGTAGDTVVPSGTVPLRVRWYGGSRAAVPPSGTSVPVGPPRYRGSKAVVPSGTTSSKSCRYCDKSFSNENSVQQHVKSIHMKIKPYPCQHCNYRCDSKKDLRKHMIYKHGYASEYQCVQCGKYLSSMSYLNKHMLSHSKQQQQA